MYASFPVLVTVTAKFCSVQKHKRTCCRRGKMLPHGFADMARADFNNVFTFSINLGVKVIASIALAPGHTGGHF